MNVAPQSDWPTFSALLKILAALVALLFFTGCTVVPFMPDALPAAGLIRVYRVADGLLRSPQPNEKQFAVLVNADNVGCVIQLNRFEGHDEPPAGVDVYRHFWADAGPVSHEDIEEALSDLEACRAAGRVVLVHCTLGRDRTGLLIALWRVRHGTLPEQAYREWVAYGSHRFFGLEETFFRETGWRP